MLARLSLGAAKLLDVRFEPGAMSVPEDEALVVDMNALRALVYPLPDIAWRRVAGLCGQTISPMCNTIHNMLNNDVHHLARLLSDLEPLREDEFLDEHDGGHGVTSRKVPYGVNELNCDAIHVEHGDLGYTSIHERPRRKRRRSASSFDRHLIIPSAHPSIPTIIVTPCDIQCHDTSSCAPYQDSSFGHRLTVPTHPVFNQLFPPLAAHPHPLPFLDTWRWANGHWEAVIPDLDEQAKRGMFSRTLTTKKRPCRRPCALHASRPDS